MAHDSKFHDDLRKPHGAAVDEQQHEMIARISADFRGTTNNLNAEFVVNDASWLTVSAPNDRAEIWPQQGPCLVHR
jgi:hypothetical protein